MDRRSFIKAGSAASIAAGLTAGESMAADKTYEVKGKLKQGVCKWCYGWVPMEEFASKTAALGIKGVDLVAPKDWPTLKKHGLVCSMTSSHGITKGLNRIDNHDECLAKIKKSIEQTSEAGFPNVICFSGNRKGMDDAEGLKNCVTALKQIVGFAEKKNVTICMELLNSKRNHKDYMCDRTHWGVELAKAVGSDNFKLLYDIYHMQVQEGDVIATIKESKDYIGHYHTAGVPGRHEIDTTQELYYPPIVEAVIKTGYNGYFVHEFRPKKKELETLAQAVELCDL